MIDFPFHSEYCGTAILTQPFLVHLRILNAKKGTEFMRYALQHQNTTLNIDLISNPGDLDSFIQQCRQSHNNNNYYYSLSLIDVNLSIHPFINEIQLFYINPCLHMSNHDIACLNILIYCIRVSIHQLISIMSNSFRQVLVVYFLISNCCTCVHI